MGRRVILPQLDKRRTEEIAVLRLPLATLPSLARILRQGDEPSAFHRRSIGKQIGIGRAGTLNDADAAQNRLPAALSLRLPSGPMSK